MRGRYFDAIASTCGFEPGECPTWQSSSHTAFHDHTSEWHLVDITNPDVKVMHGKCPYAKLEKMQPCDLSVAEFDAYSVLGKAKAAWTLCEESDVTAQLSSVCVRSSAADGRSGRAEAHVKKGVLQSCCACETRVWWRVGSRVRHATVGLQMRATA